MARAKNAGNGRLEEALVNLMQSQAALMQAQTAFLARVAEIEARMAETDARIAELKRSNAEHVGRSDVWLTRIEERWARIEALLLERGRILRELPDRICDALGLKGPTPISPSAASPR